MSADDEQGPKTPGGGESPGSQPGGESDPGTVSYTPTTDDPYGYRDDPYAAPPAEPPPVSKEIVPVKPQPSGGGGKTPPPPPPPKDPEEEEDGMLRMSFLEHLEELRHRIIMALVGLAIAFLVCVIFANDLWLAVSQPAYVALVAVGVKDGRLAQITPMETFSTVWVKVPMLASIFLVSPWIIYQVWAFIAPGLYKKERRMAAPFIICTAGLFITGGLFAYFVAFRYGLTFLLGIGRDIRIQPVVSVTEYFDLFVNVTLGVGLVFEMPVLIFFLTLLRIVTPRFLLTNSRYAILVITIIAAVVTPTPDPFNMMLFAVPMCLLYFAGVFASYLLVLRREERAFPWKPVLIWAAVVLGLAAAAIALAILHYGYRPVAHWPFLTR